MHLCKRTFYTAKGTFYTPKADISEHEKEHFITQKEHEKQLILKQALTLLIDYKHVIT